MAVGSREISGSHIFLCPILFSASDFLYTFAGKQTVIQNTILYRPYAAIRRHPPLASTPCHRYAGTRHSQHATADRAHRHTQLHRTQHLQGP